MNINLHIQRMVVDGIPLGRGQSPLLQMAVEKELTRLLGNGGLSDTLQAGGAFYNLRTAGIQLADSGNATGLGEQIAGAVYQGIGK